MYQAVEMNRSGFDFWDEDLEEDDDSDDMDDFFNIVNLDERWGSRKTKTAGHKEEDSKAIKNELGNKFFVYNVKPLDIKKAKKQFEIKGSQTLDDLHELIFDAFKLDWGHLYSFFMSNKPWDAKTEYSHPQAEGKSAAKASVCGLNLRLKQKFMYIYDYGDEYRFEVELTEIKDQ
ncbi:MAG: IS1096 element passenger TnpR family protein [Caulobacteraceae bacterium]